MHSSRLATSLACVLTVATPALAEDFVLVKNAGITTDALTPQQVRALFLGETKTWDGGGAVQVVLPEGEEGVFKAFAAAIFRVPAGVLRGKQKQEVFKGELRKPLACSSDTACLELVKSTKGAVGVVSAEAAAHLPAGVALLKVSN